MILLQILISHIKERQNTG